MMSGATRVDHARITIRVGPAHRFAVEGGANETTRGPFTDIAADVEQSVGIAAEGADWLRCQHEAGGSRRLGFAARDLRLRRVSGIDQRYRLRPHAFGGSELPQWLRSRSIIGHSANLSPALN
jgi:hypothetical protein